MSQESFEIEVEGGTIAGTLTRPDSADRHRTPAVLICRGLHTFQDETTEFLSDAASSLRDHGIGTVDFEARSAKMILDDFHAYTPADNLDDTTAVFDWMLAHDDVNVDAIGVLGYNLGGVTAACLAGRTDRINHLALLAPGAAAAGESTVEIPDGYRAALVDMKPLEALVQYDRPTLVVHGAADRDIDPDASFEYRRALESAGRPVEHLQVALADHTFSWSEARTACVQQLDRFFGGMKGRRKADS